MNVIARLYHIAFSIGGKELVAVTDVGTLHCTTFIATGIEKGAGEQQENY
jgi:hypothetical protein